MWFVVLGHLSSSIFKGFPGNTTVAGYCCRLGWHAALKIRRAEAFCLHVCALRYLIVLAAFHKLRGRFKTLPNW